MNFRIEILSNLKLLRAQICQQTETRPFYIPVSILAGNANEIQQFYEQFVNKFDTHRNSKLAKISILKFMFKMAYLYQYLMASNKSGLVI